MNQRVQTWLGTAENDLEFAEQILKNRQRPSYALHFCHQAIQLGGGNPWEGFPPSDARAFGPRCLPPPRSLGAGNESPRLGNHYTPRQAAGNPQVEKILKAVVHHATGKEPPRTHNFEKLLALTGKELPPDKLNILIDLAPHYLSTKYPEDLAKFAQQYSHEFVQSQYNATKELFLWIKTNWLT